MSIPSDLLALLSLAVNLRVSGKTWSDTAKELAAEELHLRALAAEYPRDYDRLARRARVEAAKEALDDAIAALRDLTRSEDPATRIAAATTLVRYALADMRHSEKRADAQYRRAMNFAPTALNPHAPQESLGRRVREPNVSETIDVKATQGVTARKNVAQNEPPRPTKPVQNITGQATQKQKSLLTDPVANQFTPSPTVRNVTGEPPIAKSWLGG